MILNKKLFLKILILNNMMIVIEMKTSNGLRIVIINTKLRNTMFP